VLARTIAPLCYPVHALQMIAAYIGQLAPSGRIVVACAFQAADEVRRVQRLAYRARQLGFGDDRRAIWERDEAWQPLRRVVERLLVTWDWGEAFTALNLCLKPALDELTMVRFADAARAAGDGPLAELLFSLDEDCRWHREWSAALVRTAVDARATNRTVLDGWIATWQPRAHEAIAALTPLFEAQS
jgi:toluene monooxygenase system protein E